MTKLEEIARAIFETWRAAENADGTWAEAVKGHAHPELYPNAHRIVELALAEARAAVEAMRLLAPAQRVPGVSAYVNRTGQCEPIAFKEAWEAIIHAILSEHDGRQK